MYVCMYIVVAWNRRIWTPLATRWPLTRFSPSARPCHSPGREERERERERRDKEIELQPARKALPQPREGGRKETERERRETRR